MKDVDASDLMRGATLCLCLALTGSACRRQPSVAVIGMAEATPNQIRVASDEISSWSHSAGAEIRFVNGADAPGALGGIGGEVERAGFLAKVSGLVGVVGHLDSRSSLIAAPIYNEARIPQLVPTATSRILKKAGPWTFMLAPDDALEGAFIGDFVANQLHARSATIFYQLDEYGRGLRDGVLEAFGKWGVKVIDQTPFDWLHTESQSGPPEFDFPSLVAASSLRRHSEALQAEFAAVRDPASALKTAFAEARQLLRAEERQPGAPQAAAARSLLTKVQAQLDDTRAIESARTLAGITSEMRIALSRAADAESQLGVALIEVLSRIELGDYQEAAARLSYCDSLNDLTAGRLAEAQAAGLTDVIERQRALGAAADLSIKAVAWWAAAGLALVPLLALFVQRRFYARLAALDTGLSRVAEGRLDTAVEVGRADELGRLSMHFNEMTAVLRQRADEERRQQEKELSEQRAYLDELFEGAPEAIVLLDTDDRLLRANSEFTRMFGYTLEEVLHQPFNDRVVPPEQREEGLGFMGQALRGERVNVERVRMRKDGSRFHASIVVFPITTSEGHIAFYSIYRDITERKQAEEALRQSEEKFAKAFHSSPDSIMISRIADGLIIDVNDNFTHRTGYLREEAIGRTSEELNLLAPEDRARMVEIAKEQGSVRNFEFVFHRKSGESGVGLFSGEFMELGGELCGLSLVRDITDRKRVEEELEKSLQQLRALSDHLRQVREEERTHIAREIHDELGQALTALRVDLSWLAEKLPPGEGKLAERIEAMSSLADSIIETVQKISTELRPGILDNLGLTAAIEWQTEEFSSRTGIHCNLDCLEEIDGLDQARSTACFRILQETLTNVARHAGATEVQVSLKRQAESLMLQVRDNGRGISEDEITDRTAIGLLGMKERAHALGGKLDIKGITGKGTSVTVSIPLTSPATGSEML